MVTVTPVAIPTTGSTVSGSVPPATITAGQPNTNAGTSDPGLAAKEEQKPADELAPKFAHLARKEKEMRIYARQLQAQAEAIKAQTAQNESLKSRIDEYDRLQGKFKQNPVDALKDVGLSIQQLNDFYLNGGYKPEEVELQNVKTEIMALKQAQEEHKKVLEQQTQQELQQATTQMLSDTKRLIAAEPAFETIKSTGNEAAVVELVKQEYYKTGNLLTLEEAAAEVEDYLVEEAMKFAQIPKVKARIAPAPETAAPEKTLTEKPGQPFKTLVHSLNANTPQQRLTAAERKQRAILAFQGKLGT